MDEKIKNLWTNNRVLFFVLLPLIIVAVLVLVFRDLILSFLIGSARKVTADARKQDEVLKEQIQNTVIEVTKETQKASDAAAKIEDRKVVDISVNWYKDKGKK